MACNLRAASNLIAMASNLRAMACNLGAMASNLIAMTSVNLVSSVDQRSFPQPYGAQDVP